MPKQTQFRDLVRSELSRIESLVIEHSKAAPHHYHSVAKQATILARQHTPKTPFFWPVMRLIALF